MSLCKQSLPFTCTFMYLADALSKASSYCIPLVTYGKVDHKYKSDIFRALAITLVN